MFILFGHGATVALVENECSLYFGSVPKVTEQHLEARRRQILDAALTCFSRDGFHRTPMQAIFEESGLSPGAVYRYFKSKEDIVAAIASETLMSFAAAVRAGPPGGPDVVLGRLLDTIETVELRDKRLRLALQVWGEAMFNPRVAGFVRGAIEDLQERVAAELDEPDQARALVALLQGSVVQRDVYGEDFDAAAFRAAALALVSQREGASRLKGVDEPPRSRSQS
jgi:TetR/AcrR family transcriptional regulator, transcriptional repressor of aconitase